MIKRRRARGQSIPKEWIQPQPKLHLRFAVTAFYALNTERRPAMSGVSPIPWSSVIMYGDIYCIDDDQVEWLWTCVREMDTVYLRYHNSKVKQHGKTR